MRYGEPKRRSSWTQAMMVWLLAPCLACVLLVCVRAVLGDVVHMKDGRTFEGEVTEEEGRVAIKMSSGIRLVVKREEVASIEEKLTPKQEYEQRRASLSDDDLQGHETLAQWCAEKGLREQAMNEFLLVHALKVQAISEPSVETETELEAWAREHGLKEQAARHLSAVYQIRAGKLEARDALAHAELAEWCYGRELDEEGSRHLRRAYEMDRSLSKVREVFDRLKVAIYSNSPIRGGVILEDYSMSWDGNDRPLVHRMDLKIHPLGAKAVRFTTDSFSLIVNGQWLKCEGLGVGLSSLSAFEKIWPHGGHEWVSISPVFEGPDLKGKEVTGALAVKGRPPIRFRRTLR